MEIFILAGVLIVSMMTVDGRTKSDTNDTEDAS